MAICGGCGAETTRTRTVFNDKTGVVVKEECDKCAPQSFDPQWLTARGATPWEAYPGKYKKIENHDGSITWRSTDEWRADSEAKIIKAYEKADAADAEKLERKRRNRRTTPMTEAEIHAATERWRPVLEDRQEMANRSYNKAVEELTQ